MLIEILYIHGSPNHQPALVRLKKVLQSEAVDAEIHQVVIADERTARALQFPGSPTILINGQDAEPSSQAFGMTCRLHSGGGGVPSEATLRHAIYTARIGEETQ